MLHLVFRVGTQHVPNLIKKKKVLFFVTFVINIINIQMVKPPKCIMSHKEKEFEF